MLRDWRYETKRVEELTVYEFYMALARLGGHTNRKRDGFPGWLTLWRGAGKSSRAWSAASKTNDADRRKIVWKDKRLRFPLVYACTSLAMYDICPRCRAKCDTSRTSALATVPNIASGCAARN